MISFKPLCDGNILNIRIIRCSITFIAIIEYFKPWGNKLLDHPLCFNHVVVNHLIWLILDGWEVSRVREYTAPQRFVFGYFQLEFKPLLVVFPEDVLYHIVLCIFLNRICELIETVHPTNNTDGLCQFVGGEIYGANWDHLNLFVVNLLKIRSQKLRIKSRWWSDCIASKESWALGLRSAMFNFWRLEICRIWSRC